MAIVVWIFLQKSEKQFEHTKEFSYNKLFWKSVKPFFSDKMPIIENNFSGRKWHK